MDGVAAVGEACILEGLVDGVQFDTVGALLHVQLDSDLAEGLAASEAGVNLDVVAAWQGACGQPVRLGVLYCCNHRCLLVDRDFALMERTYGYRCGRWKGNGSTIPC